MVYITSIEQLAKEEGMQAGMQQGMQAGMQQGMQAGMERGMQQGRLTGKLQLLARLLGVRFGELPSWAVDRLAGADEHTLDAWTEAVLTAQSLDALFGVPKI